MNFDFPHPCDRLGGSRLHAAVHGNGNLQQRNDTESYEHYYQDIISDIGGNGEQRRTRDHRGSGDGHDHGYLRDDQRLGHVDGHSRSVDFDFGYAQRRLGGSRLHAAVHRNGNLQQRNDATSHHGDLDFLGNFDRNSEQRRIGHSRGSGDGNDHCNFGHHQRVCDVNGRGARIDFIVDHAIVRVDCKWDKSAVYGDGKLQRRQHPESDEQCNVEFVFNHRGHYRGRRSGDRRRCRHVYDHS